MFLFPTSPNTGDTMYNNGTRYYYDGFAWKAAVKNAVGTRSKASFISTSGQTLFLTSFSVDNSEVFINGIKLDNSDYSTDSNGLVTLNVAPATGSNVEIIGYGVYDILNQIYFNQSTTPQNPVAGSLWYNTSTNVIQVYNSSTSMWEGMINSTTIDLNN
jgi:hypothetical protein